MYNSKTLSEFLIILFSYNFEFSSKNSFLMCMFDAQNRVLFLQDLYLNLFRLTSFSFVPSQFFRDLLVCGSATGNRTLQKMTAKAPLKST